MIRTFVLDQFPLNQHRLPTGEYYFTCEDEPAPEKIQTRLKSTTVLQSSKKVFYAGVKLPIVFIENGILTLHLDKDQISSYELKQQVNDHLSNIPIPFFREGKAINHALIRKWSSFIREAETKRLHSAVQDLMTVVKLFNNNFGETVTKSDCALQLAEDLLKSRRGDKEHTEILDEMEVLFGYLNRLIDNNSSLEFKVSENQKILNGIYTSVTRMVPEPIESELKE